MAGDKELKIKITGDATQLGAASQRAVASINQVKSSMTDLVGAFTGGLIGGGVTGVLSNLVSAIGNQISNARALAREARGLGVTDTFLKGSQTLGSILFDQKDLIPSAISEASQKRSDAVQGDQGALRALAALGLNPQGIAGLSKEELFNAIIRAFREGPDTNARRVAVADLFGDSNANKLLGYMVGGNKGQYDLAGLIQKLGNDPTIALPGFGFAREAIRRNLDENYRGSVEPISRAGIGNAKREEDLRRENDQRELHNARERMTIEERIASIAEERARLQEKMAAESNGETREKIRTDLLQLDAERIRLEKSPAQSGRTASALQSFAPQADEFAQRGIFIGGQQRVPAILERQLVELQVLVREIRETRRDNKEAWG